jgi:hypothetical protein
VVFECLGGGSLTLRGLEGTMGTWHCFEGRTWKSGKDKGCLRWLVLVLVIWIFMGSLLRSRCSREAYPFRR